MGTVPVLKPREVVALPHGPWVRSSSSARFSQAVPASGRALHHGAIPPRAGYLADYFSLIDAEEEITGTEISPRVRFLFGGFKGAITTEEDYRRHLEEEYR